MSKSDDSKSRLKPRWSQNVERIDAFSIPVPKSQKQSMGKCKINE